MYLNKGLLMSLLCVFFLPIAEARDCAIKIVSVTENMAGNTFFLPMGSTGTGSPSLNNNYGMDGPPLSVTIKTFPSVTVEPGIYAEAISDMYNDGLSTGLRPKAYPFIGPLSIQENYAVPMSVILSGNEITFKPENSILTGFVPQNINNNGASIRIISNLGNYLPGVSFSSAHPGWCEGPVSAGSTSSVVIKNKNRMEIGEIEIKSPAGVVLYSGTSVVNDAYMDALTNTISFIETPYVSVSTRVSEIDFGRVESGKSVVQPLDIELKSNVINAAVTLTYEFRNVNNEAGFSVKGLNGAWQEDVVTSPTKNSELIISRDIEISESSNTIIGPYEGVLSITATLK